MDVYSDLSRQLLKNSNTASKAYQQTTKEVDNSEDPYLFYELAVKATTAQMAYLEHNRTHHMLLKTVFVSVP